MRIRILLFTLMRIRIPGSKKHRIPDPDPQYGNGTGYYFIDWVHRGNTPREFYEEGIM
jgi:hypothetical protein